MTIRQGTLGLVKRYVVDDDNYGRVRPSMPMPWFVNSSLKRWWYLCELLKIRIGHASD